MKANSNHRRFHVSRILLSLILSLLSVSVAEAQGKASGPELLQYPDLVALYENEKPDEDLQLSPRGRGQ